MAKRKAYKFDAIKKTEYLELLREGGRRMASARAVGVVPETVEKHMRRYPSFKTEVSKAEMEANQSVEDALFQAAISGNVVAAQVWLYNRMPDRWENMQRNKTEITGADGGPIQQQSITINISPDVVQEALAILAESGSTPIGSNGNAPLQLGDGSENGEDL